MSVCLNNRSGYFDQCTTIMEIIQLLCNNDIDETNKKDIDNQGKW